MLRTDLTVILPTYQEQETIVPLIRGIEKAIRPEMIIVVDDSPDNATVSAVSSLSNNIPVRAIQSNPPLGLTGSLNRGIQEVHTTYVAWMDADLSHPPELLGAMYQLRNHATIISASWLMPGGTDERHPLTRAYSTCINTICQWCFGSVIHAYTSGYVLLPTKLAASGKLRGIYGDYCIDLFVRLKRKGYSIREIPYALKERTVGYSKTRQHLGQFARYGTAYLATIARLFMTRNNTV